MINFNNIYNIICNSSFSEWIEILPKQLNLWKKEKTKNNKFKKWINTVKYLPIVFPEKLNLIDNIFAENKNFSFHQRIGIYNLLKNLIPWRKGPFFLYGICIDGEWRSDLKWKRLKSYLPSLENCKILDVGCNNGYYMWRMIGLKAKLVIGLDPNPLCFFQFEAIRKLLQNNQNIHLLPIKIKFLPRLQSFDFVFSMGVLYHCKSPLIHLLQLKDQLIKGGKLILETLIIIGKKNTILVPKKKYANMSNVWFIPSISILKIWLQKCGFNDIKIIHYCFITKKEQRETNWTVGKSLSAYLNTKNYKKTIEGYQAPVRAIFIAKKS